MRRLTTTIQALIAALATIAIAASAASAQPPAIAGYSPTDVQKALDVADAHWTPNACAGRTEIRLVPPAATTTGTHSSVRAGAAVLGDAYRGSCVIEINDGTSMTLAMLCTLIQHEQGHLLGLEHTDNPASVMYPLLQAPTLDCQQAFPPNYGLPTPTEATPTTAGIDITVTPDSSTTGAGPTRPATRETVKPTKRCSARERRSEFGRHYCKPAAKRSAAQRKTRR